jgi:hypothetical protein
MPFWPIDEGTEYMAANRRDYKSRAHQIHVSGVVTPEHCRSCTECVGAGLEAARCMIEVK